MYGCVLVVAAALLFHQWAYQNSSTSRDIVTRYPISGPGHGSGVRGDGIRYVTGPTHESDNFAVFVMLGGMVAFLYFGSKLTGRSK